MSRAPRWKTAAVATLFCAGITSALAQGDAAPGLDAKVAALVAEPSVAHANWGVMVTTLDGTPLYALNEGKLFQPASNTKLFTTAAALALLKSTSRFETRVIAEGGLAGGSLHGDLILKGDGDANLSQRTIPFAPPPVRENAYDSTDPIDDLAAQIAATGLKLVEGDIVGDDTLFPWQPYPAEWAADDLLWGYGAPVSALSVDDNQIQLTIGPGVLPKEGARPAGGPTPAKITLVPSTSFYTVQNDAVTVEAKTKAAIGIERLPGSRTLRIFGTIAAGAQPEVEEIAINDPAEFAAIRLKQALAADGVVIRGKAVARHRASVDAAGFLGETRMEAIALEAASAGAVEPCLRCNVANLYPDGQVLAARRSPTVGQDIKVTNKVSQNLHAELFLHQLGVAFGTDGSNAQGARVIRQFAINAGVDPDDFVFYDGSGMSGHDLVAPRAIARLLQFATRQPWFAEYRASLPIGGVDGSLEHRFTALPLKGHIFAKTGTNSESRALSGYLDCASGRTVIFSILVGNHSPVTSADRDVMDRIVAAIAASE